MTLTVLSLIALAALMATCGVCTLIHATRDSRAEPLPEPARAKRVYIRGLCPYCGELDVVLRQDGEPSRRHHPCKLAADPLAPPSEAA